MSAGIGSDFHVPGQNYGAQPGGQVGGGGGSIGVSGGRGPPSIGIQSIGQSTQGIQSGSGPSGGQQQSNQPPTTGVQQQQSQGQAPTTTPLGHTPSPQEMGKPIHHQTQAASLQQSYVSNPTRAVPQGFYSMGPRPVQPRSSIHRNSQGGGVTHVVGMQSASGGAGQPPAMFQAHHTSINVPGAQTIYIPSQVPNMHPGQHQQMYSVGNQMAQITFPGQHRHPTHSGQHFFSYQGHTLIQPNVFPFPTGPATTPLTFCYPSHPPPNAIINSNRANNTTISGAQHVGPLAGAQATTAVPQGTLQQTTPQPQALPQMAIPLTQPAYAGHNATTANSLSNAYQKPKRSKAILDIVNPATGENISELIYREALNTSNDDAGARETSKKTQGSVIAAEFASRVAQAAHEDSSNNTSNSVATSAQTNSQQSSNQSNAKSQSNLTKDSVSSQCNKNSSVPTQVNANTVSTAPPDLMHSTATAVVDSSVPKLESKPTMAQAVDSKSHNEIQPTTQVESTSPTSGSPKVEYNVGVSASHSVSEVEAKTTSSPESLSPTNVPSFSPSTVKSSSSSPPRRKNNNYSQQQFQSSQAIPSSTGSVLQNNAHVTAEAGKDLKEKKVFDKPFVPKGVSQTSTPPQSDVTQQQKANGERIEDKLDTEVGGKLDLPQKSADGNKTMQKQKNKNKFKGRDINRKGAEKEGTDMDAFVNPSLQSMTPEVAKSQELQESSSSPTSNSEQSPARNILTEEKEVCEVKIDDLEPETQIKPQPVDKIINSSECVVKNIDSSDDKLIVTTNKNTPDNETISNDAIIQDSNKCASMIDQKTNDVVDHSKIVSNDTVSSEVEAIVAQKNEENAKVSTLASNNSSVNPAAVIDSNKQSENETSNKIGAPAKPAVPQLLRYQYSPNQWSPKNTSGKKEYDRDFLMKLQDDPRSRIKPPNLPDLDVVLKDCSRQTSRNTSLDMRMFKDSRAHEQLLPGFMKSSYNPKLPLPSKKSYQGKSKMSKSGLIHVTLSLREDVKLRETENAWKPARLKKEGETLTEDDKKTQVLYKKVRSVLNKLTPQKFDTLVNQVRTLEIDSEDKLQGVIDLVFEKAVDEPSFSVAYALMCKELALIKVASNQKKSAQEADNFVNFRKLLLTRCQMEFEKNSVEESARLVKVKEIDNCVDAEKKKELQTNLAESDRQIRLKSVGNIRFIGELYKQDMLTANIMRKCITHLLDNIDEDNLECLCKLLTTIGKIFEVKNDLNNYFQTLNDLASGRQTGRKISSRVRFMIQDVIDLRRSNWIPRRDDSNPKTMDQIQKEAESERIDIQLNNISMNTPRGKDDRNDRRRRGAGSSLDEGGWSTPVGSSKVRQSYSVEASKLNTKSMPLNEITLGSRHNYVWNSSSATSGKPVTPVTPNKYAILESMSLEDKRPPIPLSGSRSTGPREYRSEYKAWGDGSRGSRNGSSHQMGSSSSISSSSRESSLLMEGARSQSISMPSSAMKMKPPTSMAPPMLNTASSSNSNVSSNKTPKTETQLLTAIHSLLSECTNISSLDLFIKTAMETIDDSFDSSSYPLFVSETINKVLERSTEVRRRFSVLLSKLINENYVSLSLFQLEYEKVLEIADDLVIDIPMIWTYLTEILSGMVISGAHPFSELKKTLTVLKSSGTCSLVLGGLLATLAKEKGPKWVVDNWDQSELQWSDFVDPKRENLDKMIQSHNLQFMSKGSSGSFDEMTSGDSNMSYADVCDHLVKLMRESDFDNITSWINLNVGQRLKEPQFVRTLTTAILIVSVENSANGYKLNTAVLKSWLPIIRRYVDTEPQLELQCLYAIQSHLHKIDFPRGILSNIIDAVYNEDLISDDAFLAWQQCTDPAETALGHSIAVTSLTSFFVNLREIPDESSEEA
ncbi:eukaryotic translation initiation factor 4 gamma 3-like isoform X3 [Cotesia glomerata]|uniref:eukaryotic translation initiation factor 4 gamma 3-like isoform X3 n=1 Tax=Cotesia glomerata TaxID=32391 RepID=UPI001D0272D3|nr:eukaryotic translation initiation factor 4 gamma 3-like isoform X3 [Cotesia glomerata]